MVDPRTEALVRSVAADRVALNAKVADAAVALAEAGSWAAAVRVIVRVGGVGLDEFVAAGVTASTARRWCNGEAAPLPGQAGRYMGDLVRHLVSRDVADIVASVGLPVAASSRTPEAEHRSPY